MQDHARMLIHDAAGIAVRLAIALALAVALCDAIARPAAPAASSAQVEAPNTDAVADAARELDEREPDLVAQARVGQWLVVRLGSAETRGVGRQIFALEDGPAGVALSQSGTLVWRADRLGRFTVRVSVRDRASGQVSRRLVALAATAGAGPAAPAAPAGVVLHEIDVKAREVRSPEAPKPVIEVPSKKQLRVLLQAAGVGSEPMRLMVRAPKPGMSVDEATGSFVWEPEIPGREHAVSVIVTPGRVRVGELAEPVEVRFTVRSRTEQQIAEDEARARTAKSGWRAWLSQLW